MSKISLSCFVEKVGGEDRDGKEDVDDGVGGAFLTGLRGFADLKDFASGCGLLFELQVVGVVVEWTGVDKRGDLFGKAAMWVRNGIVGFLSDGGAGSTG